MYVISMKLPSFSIFDVLIFFIFIYTIFINAFVVTIVYTLHKFEYIVLITEYIVSLIQGVVHATTLVDPLESRQWFFANIWQHMKSM